MREDKIESNTGEAVGEELHEEVGAGADSKGTEEASDMLAAAFKDLPLPPSSSFVATSPPVADAKRRSGAPKPPAYFTSDSTAATQKAFRQSLGASRVPYGVGQQRIEGVSTAHMGFGSSAPSVEPPFVSDFDVTGISVQETAYDGVQNAWIKSLEERVQRAEAYIQDLNYSVGGYEVATRGATQTAGNAERSLNEFKLQADNGFSELHRRIDAGDSELSDFAEKVARTELEVAAIQKSLNMTSVNLSRRLSDLSQEIIAAARVYEMTKADLLTAQGDKTDLNQKAKEQLAEIDDLAKEFLKLRVEQALGAPNISLRSAKITLLKAQLEEITTRKQDDNLQATSRWSGWFSTNKEKKAFDSVGRFAKNPALSSIAKENVDVNVELLSTMISATYALTYFDKAHTAPAANISAPVSANPSISTPPRTASVSVAPGSASTPAQQRFEETDVVNKAVLLHVRQELAKLQTRTDGLIGSQNPTMQFWGKVLLALALAIAATVAAIALMSALGFALPTFLVPYVAYLQASALVSTVLTFVSTQLSITVAASASATALLTAGIFGGVGYGLNRAGAPSSLKKDLDHAAKDLDAAIVDTPAFRAIRAGA